MKAVEAAPIPPPDGPVSVKLEAGATGVAAVEAPDDPPVPIAFVAATEQVYAVPLVRPETLIGLADPVAVMPPGSHVTV